MRNRLLQLTVLLIFFTSSVQAQLIGGDAFLQGAYVEVGELNNGAFGTCAGLAPAGYHSHCPACADGNGLSMIYNWNHTGWTSGTGPVFGTWGDYTFPGTPFEGWEMQVNGVRSQAMQGSIPAGYTALCPAIYSGGTLTGSMTSYTNAGGTITGSWTGSCGGLTIYQDTRVDTYASWVVVTTRMYNNTLAAIPNVYYLRTTDPDNDQVYSGNFATVNTVVYQNDADHRVLVSANGTSYTNIYLGLGTKDCRAKCFWYSGWPIATTADLATVYASGGGIGTSGITVGSTTGPLGDDWGIGLVYNLGTIAAGDSTVISYAYIFGNNSYIDSAFPDPVLALDSSIVIPPPGDTIDTFRMCSLPRGIDTIGLEVYYGSDKDWTWSNWTWAPATGLSATTGTHVTLTGSLMTGTTTYTITGTDSAMGMYSCAHKTLRITIIPCHYAHANAPCIGDTLTLNMLGDSLGATYAWTGPGGFTDTNQTFFFHPSVWSDTGMYYVIKTLGTQKDTDSVHVLIHPLPIVTVTSSLPYCGQITPQPFTVTLTDVLDSLGETFMWTGPNGFTSTLQVPSINPFDSSMGGTYKCVGTTIWGCPDSASITLAPGVTASFPHPLISFGCVTDTVTFADNTYNANAYSWSFGDGSPADLNRNTMHIYDAHHEFNVTLTATNPNCKDSITETINLLHDINAVFSPSPDTICYDNASDIITMVDSSYADDSSYFGIPPTTYLWKFGDGDSSTTAGNQQHTYSAPGSYAVNLTVTDAMGCISTLIKPVYVVQLGVTSFHDTTLCLSQPLALNLNVTSIPQGFVPLAAYEWFQSSPNLDSPTIRVPHVSGIGYFIDNVIITLPNVVPDGCPIYDTITIHSVPPAPVTNISASQTIEYGSSVQLNSDNETLYYWTPNDGSLSNNNINNPVATPEHTTLYTVYGYDQYGCIDSAFVTIYVDTSVVNGIPSAFTPNGDGLNDIFKPIGMQFQNLVEMRIFNRWGEQVFYTNNKEIGWDGTYKNTPQDMGTYNYVIIVANPDGGNKVFKGNVLLIR